MVNIIKESNKKNKNEEIPLKYFDIIAHGYTKVEVRYTVLAKDENEAVLMIKSNKVMPKHISKPIIHFGMFTELSVFIAGTINKLLKLHLK